MATYELIRGNEIFNLTDGSLAYRISAAGVGLSNVRRLKERAPFQHGVSDLGFRLDERLITLMLFQRAATLAELDAKRDQLMEALKPVEDRLFSLRVTRDDGAIRQIDGAIEGLFDVPDTPTNDRIGPSQRVLVPIYCPNPIWYEPTLRRVVFTNIRSAGYHVPLEVPIVQTGDRSINAVQSLTYTGNWFGEPVIYVRGPAEDLRITNLATGAVLDFTGSSVEGGETWTIDLRYDYQLITSDVHGDIEWYLTESSDKASFYLAAHPEARDGINDIQVTIADAVTDATFVEVTYYNRYSHL